MELREEARRVISSRCLMPWRWASLSRGGWQYVEVGEERNREATGREAITNTRSPAKLSKVLVP